MAKSMRRRWSPEEKARILRKFHASGLSREAFAREVGIAPSVVANWLRKESRGELSGPKPALVSVQVKRDSQDERGLIEIVVHGGRRIRVGEGFDEKLLAQVIATLERC